MHTRTKTDSASLQHHRLYVAAPLFAVCLFISFAPTFWHQAMLSGLPVTEAVQTQGNTTLVAARGYKTLDVHGMHLAAWNGVFEVVANDDQATIVALTTPVIVRNAGTMHIVPAGMQLTDGMLQHLPSHYLEDHLLNAQKLVAGLPRGDATLPERLANAVADGTEAVLLPSFMSDADSCLLALFHPAVRSKAWVIGCSDAPAEDVHQATLLLPQSDSSREAVAPLAVRMWAEGLQGINEETLRELADDVSALYEAGYLQRAKRYAQALLAVMDSEELRNIVDGEPVSAEPVVVQEPVAAIPETAPTVAEPVPPGPEIAEQMESNLRAALMQQGFMFTSRTILKAVSTTRIAVDGIVLGTRSGDKLLRFQFDTVTNQVTQIEQDGQILPNSLPLEQYVEWVRGS